MKKSIFIPALTFLVFVAARLIFALTDELLFFSNIRALISFLSVYLFFGMVFFLLKSKISDYVALVLYIALCIVIVLRFENKYIVPFSLIFIFVFRQHRVSTKHEVFKESIWIVVDNLALILSVLYLLYYIWENLRLMSFSEMISANTPTQLMSMIAYFSTLIVVMVIIISINPTSKSKKNSNKRDSDKGLYFVLADLRRGYLFAAASLVETILYYVVTGINISVMEVFDLWAYSVIFIAFDSDVYIRLFQSKKKTIK